VKYLKQRIQRGESVFGCWLNLGSSVSAEIVGFVGFDWVLIDLEHGCGTESDAFHQLQVLEHGTAATIVRVESYERQRFHRVLDFGAEGIMCPRIKTPQEAQRAANALRYSPEGLRGVAKMVRATNFGNNFSDYYANTKNNIVGIVQIETQESLNCLDEIAAIDGIDVLFVGPADLSMALGIYDQLDHPRFLEALKETANAAKRVGKATGILMSNPDEYAKYQSLGFQLIACGSDATFVNNGALSMIEALKSKR
jgi:4-hydroxy-2-oxoheptanedioate aldolase